MQDTKFDFSTGKLINRVSGEVIPDDEPVMFFRARDIYAVQTIEFYMTLIQNEFHQKVVSERVEDFERFATDHPERMKEPGITRHFKLRSPTT
jgi:hypothetical protein